MDHTALASAPGFRRRVEEVRVSQGPEARNQTPEGSAFRGKQDWRGMAAAKLPGVCSSRKGPAVALRAMAGRRKIATAGMIESQLSIASLADLA